LRHKTLVHPVTSAKCVLATDRGAVDKSLRMHGQTRTSIRLGDAEPRKVRSSSIETIALVATPGDTASLHIQSIHGSQSSGCCDHECSSRRNTHANLCAFIQHFVMCTWAGATPSRIGRCDESLGGRRPSRRGSLPPRLLTPWSAQHRHRAFRSVPLSLASQLNNSRTASRTTSRTVGARDRSTDSRSTGSDTPRLWIDFVWSIQHSGRGRFDPNDGAKATTNVVNRN
jgi:hypothetical protein